MGFWLASDRYTNPDGSHFVAAPDIVFPAIYAGTLRFLNLLPLSAAEDSLDLCAGAGVGAFVLSRCSKRAVSADISVRATQFANFNRYLNHLDHVEVVCGDLYEPVAGRTFDRIVAHPPYVPSVKDVTIWRDGGATGERVVRSIVEQLPDYLRPGGLLCVVSLGLDTKEGSFEWRVRQWLKQSAHEFDIIFATMDERKTPKEVLRNLAEREGGIGAEERQVLEATFAEAGIVNMPRGALVVRRHESGPVCQPWTLRTRLSDLTDGADFEQTFTEHSLFLDSEFVRSLTNSRPRLAPRLEVTVTNIVYEGALVPARFIFETDKPFKFSVQMDGWTVPLVAQFDGNVTPQEVYENARAAGDVPEDFGPEDFIVLVARMIERRLLERSTDS
jgi:SAM-dependent methyltransferase